MRTTTIECELTGTTALLQHRFTETDAEDGKKSTRRVNLNHDTPREAAERVAYRDKEGYLYHPGAGVARLIREAGGAHKQKGSRKSIKYIVPAAVRIVDDCMPLFGIGGLEKLKDFEVDSRPVTIPATKGRIMRHRPRIENWVLKVRIVVNEDVLGADVIHELLIEGGQQIGIGDYRPERGGPFGTFRVTHWEVSSEQEEAEAAQ